MIIASLPTIPQRKESLQQVLRRILYEQTVPVDKLHVWLNGYKHQDSAFPSDERVVYHLEPTNPGPWVRYQVIENLSNNDVMVTLDDDVAYPPNYIEQGLCWLKEFGYGCAVCFSAIRWDPLVESYSYTTDRYQYMIEDSLSKPVPVALHKGQSSFFYVGNVKGCVDFPLPGFKTNDDMMVASFLQRNRTAIICCPKQNGWLQNLPSSGADHALFRRDAECRGTTFAQMVTQLAFDPTAGVTFDGKSPRVLVISHTCPPIDSAELEHALIERAADGSCVHLLAPVSASKVGLVERHVDVPYVIHAESVPEQGGRLDWFSPVRHWRNARVQREAQARFLRRLDVVMRKLKPTRVEWFGKELPVWWRQRFGNETLIHFH